MDNAPDTLDRVLDAMPASGLGALDETLAGLGLAVDDLRFVGGRDELEDRLLDRYQHRMNEAVFRPYAEAASHERALHRLFDDIAKWIMADGRQGCLLLNAAADRRGTDARLAGRAGRWRSHIRATVAEGLMQRGHPVDTAYHRAEVILVAIIGLVTLVQAGAPDDEVLPPFLAVQSLADSWV